MAKKYRKIQIVIGILILILLSSGILGTKNKNKKNIVTSKKLVRIGLPGISNQTLEAAGIAVNKKYFEEELEKIGYELEIIYFQQADLH